MKRRSSSPRFGGRYAKCATINFTKSTRTSSIWDTSMTLVFATELLRCSSPCLIAVARFSISW